MQGEGKGNDFIKNISPELNEGEYVFCTVTDQKALQGVNVVCSFRERESITAILPRHAADERGLPYSFVSAWITLNVYSPLDSVGFTAAFSNALAKEGIGCNVVAAYYHDHVFVPVNDAGRAMEVLRSLMDKPG